MNALLLLIVPVVVFVLFHLLKKKFPILDALAPLAQQIIVVCACIAGSMLYAKTGLPVPDELRGMQTAAVIGFIQGLASMGVHGVSKAVTPS